MKVTVCPVCRITPDFSATEAKCPKCGRRAVGKDLTETLTRWNSGIVEIKAVKEEVKPVKEEVKEEKPLDPPEEIVVPEKKPVKKVEKPEKKPPVNKTVKKSVKKGEK